MNLLAPLLLAFGPFFLWPLEFYFPYPHIIEELFKAGVVLFILKNSKNYYLTALSGIIFAFSETVFYLPNIYSVGGLNTLGLRLITTTLLHTSTLLLMHFTYNKGKLAFTLGILTSILIHFAYNMSVV